MDHLTPDIIDIRPRRFYYGWINVLVAALAMVATLPGRTQGLGLITEPLLKELHLGQVQYGVINLYATLLGAAFCLVCGPLIDRFGTRRVLTIVVFALGSAVLFMAHITTVRGLVITMTLTRGFGQSALSVVSMAIVGKWFVRRLPLAMGVYSLLLGIGFCIAFPGVGYAVIKSDWRTVWTWMGIALVAVVAPLGWLLVRRTPEAMGLTVDGNAPGGEPHPFVQTEPSPPSFTFTAALATPAFWVLALSGAMYGLLSSGILLFNESILRELGFANTMVPLVLAIITLTGLIANFGGGWLALSWPMGRLMGLAMFLLAIALAALPLVHTRAQVTGLRRRLRRLRRHHRRRLLRLLGPRLWPGPSRKNPRRRPGSNRPCVGRRPPASGQLLRGLGRLSPLLLLHGPSRRRLGHLLLRRGCSKCTREPRDRVRPCFVTDHTELQNSRWTRFRQPSMANSR